MLSFPNQRMWLSAESGLHFNFDNTWPSLQQDGVNDLSRHYACITKHILIQQNTKATGLTTVQHTMKKRKKEERQSCWYFPKRFQVGREEDSCDGKNHEV